jgi:hypothetical protein
MSTNGPRFVICGATLQKLLLHAWHFEITFRPELPKPQTIVPTLSDVPDGLRPQLGAI